MNKSAATGVRNEALKAIEALSAALDVASRGYEDVEMRQLHKQVGSIIGQIPMGLLEQVVARHSDLDDLS